MNATLARPRRNLRPCNPAADLASAEASSAEGVVWGSGSAFRHELATLPNAGGWPNEAGVHLEASRVRPLLEEAVRLESRHARA